MITFESKHKSVLLPVLAGITETIMFNANLTANIHCPACNKLKYHNQRESWTDFGDGIIRLFHVYKREGTSEYVIEDCLPSFNI